MKKMIRKTVVLAALAGLFAAVLHGCTEAPKGQATLSFHSFDGGGPKYSVTIDDTAILSCQTEKQYAKANHEELDGAGYDVVFTFTGQKEGKTTVTITGSSPISGGEVYVYEATVNKSLNVTLEQKETQAENGDMIYEEETT